MTGAKLYTALYDPSITYSEPWQSSVWKLISQALVTLFFQISVTHPEEVKTRSHLMEWLEITWQKCNSSETTVQGNFTSNS